MRIGIDIRLYHYTGVGEYIKGLLQGLTQTDFKNEYMLLTQTEDFEHIAVENSKFTKLGVRLKPFSLTESIGLVLTLRKLKLRLFHSPHFVIPFHVKGSLLVTLHDLIPLRLPHVLDGRVLEYYRYMLKMVARKAEIIIAVSNSTKADIIDFLHVPEERIAVVYGGVREMFKPVGDIDLMKRVCLAYGISGRFVVYLGQWKPHKNVEGLIKAFDYVKERTELPHKLVICGRTNSRYQKVRQLVEKLDRQKDVIFVGFVSETDLPILLSAADLLVYPSLYEGFGLPPLQAMACGTPVITSNVASLPEVVGDCGILISPYNTEELSEAIIEILTDEELHRDMVWKGLVRAKMFSCRDEALKTLELYERMGH